MKYKILENKNCFLTGSTGAIGSQIAMKLIDNKCNLFLTATNSIKLKELEQKLQSLQDSDTKIYCEIADLNNIHDINRLIAMANKYFPSIDILINSAGIYNDKYLSECTLEDYENCFNINFRAAFIFCKAFCKEMINNRWGRIINIASLSAYKGYDKTTLYCSSKHALLGFSRALNVELIKYNVRTFCVSPAGVKSAMGKLIKGENYDTMIDPNDIADFVTFISSFNGEMIPDEIRLNRKCKYNADT